MKTDKNGAQVVLACIFLFISGACALALQVGWLRELRLVFGCTTAASAATLAIFMGGMGAGSAVLGKRVDRSAGPFKLYGLLVLLTGAAALISPFLIHVIRSAYYSMGGQMRLGVFGAAAVRLLFSAVVLGAPTFLMGGTLPAAAKAITTESDTHRRNLALLYGINTLGAVCGAAAATFFMLESLGTRSTIMSASAISIVFGALAMASNRFFAPGASRAKAAGRASTAEPPAEAEMKPVKPGFIYLAAGATGFAFFLMELVWYRMLAPILSGSSYTFGLILAVALAGIGLGGAVYSWILKDYKPTLRGFALTCALEAAALAIPYAVGDRIALLALTLKEWNLFGFAGDVAGWTVVTAIVVFPAAFISGVQFPLLIGLLGKGRAAIGRHVGMTCAWNTVGAILGSLAGGFGLIPMLGALGTWMAVAGMLAALALAALTMSAGSEKPTWRFAAPACVIAIAGLSLCARGPTAVWRHAGIGAGRAKISEHAPNRVKNWVNCERRSVMWEADGIECSVAISRSDDGIAFVVNGKSDGNAIFDAATTIMLGLLGPWLHPNPETGLVIGLGTGETAGWLAEVPTMKRVDVVEIEPAMNEVARMSAAANFDVLNNKKVRRIYNDARETLMTSRDKYDLIISEPSNPYRAGIASLYTVDFYRSARARMNPGGILVQWLQAYEIDAQTVRSVLATLGEVFPQVEVWQSNPGDLLLVCSDTPIAYPSSALREKMGREPFKSGMRRAWRVNTIDGALAYFVAGTAMTEKIREADKGRFINTDDLNIIEYGMARSLGLTTGFGIENMYAEAMNLGCYRPSITGAQPDWSLVDDERMYMAAPFGVAPTLPPGASRDQHARAECMRLAFTGNTSSALATWNSQSRTISLPMEVLILAYSCADTGNDKTPMLLAEVAKMEPTEAMLLRGRFLWRMGRSAEATVALSEAFLAMRKDPWAMQWIVKGGVDAARDIGINNQELGKIIYGAIREPFAFQVFEEERLVLAANIATHLDAKTQLESIKAVGPNVFWTRSFLAHRAQVYRATHEPDAAQAEKDLAEYDANEPKPFQEGL